MSRKRFKWTRKRYEHAHWLARFLSHDIFGVLSDPPDIVRRYFLLWELHPQRDDPLTYPMRLREPYYSHCDDIPF